MSESPEKSKIALSGKIYTKEEVELILDLWNILQRIEKMKDEDERDTAEANWFELFKALFT